jgi:hypothetical protein
MITTFRSRYAAMSFDVELVPESIVVDAASTAHYNSAMENLGTKSRPHKDTESGCAMHTDGISAEFAPLWPVALPTELMAIYRTGKARIERHIGLPLRGRNYLDLAQVKGFGEIETPFLYHETQAFGCSPDYLNGRQRVVPAAVKKRTLRELGLHAHLDLRPEFCDQRDERAKAQGRMPTNAVAVAEIAQQIARRTAFLFDARHPRLSLWYRQPGLYRPTPYGIEYRAFGSEICNDEDKMHTLFNVLHQFMKEHFAGTTVRVADDGVAA